jgi:hypothetical protein
VPHSRSSISPLVCCLEEAEKTEKESGESTSPNLLDVVDGCVVGLRGGRGALSSGRSGSTRLTRRCARCGFHRRRGSESFGSRITSTALLVGRARGLTFSIIGVSRNTLDVGLLADVEGESVGVGRHIWNCAVGADAVVGESRLKIWVSRHKSKLIFGVKVLTPSQKLVEAEPPQI